MEVDESGTLAQFKALRKELIDPKIDEYSGRIVKTTGDGILVEFPSVIDAVQNAVDIQQAMAQRNTSVPDDKRIEFRIGINLGDLIIDGEDLYGDGINVAARLEGLADPGGVCISAKVFEEITNKLNLAFEDTGEHDVKNISRPVRVFRFVKTAQDRVEGAKASVRIAQVLEGPAVAVLPFTNMSKDADDEYFVDGIVEDLITALSGWRAFPVIARNSTFAYKGKAVDVRQIGRELGARYVL